MPHGYNDTQWEVAKHEATDILVGHARKGKTISYSELATLIHAVNLDYNDRRFDLFLGEICRAEANAGRGFLTVLVVHKFGDMQPGPGFFKLVKEYDIDTTDKTACWAKEFKKVCEFWKNK